VAHFHRREMNPVSGRNTRPPWRRVKGTLSLGSVARGIAPRIEGPRDGGAGKTKLELRQRRTARGRLVHRSTQPSSNAREQKVTEGGRLTVPI
jgi:hypothetical protein